MNGEHHETFSIATLILILLCMGLHWMKAPQSQTFIILWLIGTFLITCDLDTNSKSRKRLGPLGWLIDKLFPHRGLLHSVKTWVFIGLVGYACITWPILGLIIPQFLHIVMDYLSTTYKTTVGQIKRKIFGGKRCQKP